MKQFEEFAIGQIWQYVGEDRKWERIKGADDPDTFVILTDISDNPYVAEPLIFQLINSGIDATDLTYPIATVRNAFVRIS